MTLDFAELPLSALLLDVVAELGYVKPTDIQAASIPLLLAGRDIIGQSKTGSGKTAAFALPILQTIKLEPRVVQGLVVCPTRELCAQVAREFRKLGRRHAGFQVLVLAGGEPFRPQASALQRGVHVAVATPGRLLDHLTRGTFDPSSVRTVVLDEADRMLDMGFRDDMESILAKTPPSRQTVFFSATFPPSIEEMSRIHQKSAQRIEIADTEEVPSEIRQLVMPVKPENKLDALYEVLHRFPHDSALIFCNFKKTVAELGQTLSSAGLSVDSLHGDLEQFYRDQVLARFRNHSVRILIATDVAGRGIDVAELDLVVNYELPDQPDIYVHRIGRTGRAGHTGVSVSLSTPRDKAKIAAIEASNGYKLERLHWDPTAAANRDELVGRLAIRAAMDTVVISGGRKDKIRPGDILGALTGETCGLDSRQVGKIEIHDRLTYVAVARSESRRVVKSLNAGRIKAKRFRVSLLKNG